MKEKRKKNQKWKILHGEDSVSTSFVFRIIFLFILLFTTCYMLAVFSLCHQLYIAISLLFAHSMCIIYECRYVREENCDGSDDKGKSNTQAATAMQAIVVSFSFNNLCLFCSSSSFFFGISYGSA